MEEKYDEDGDNVWKNANMGNAIQSMIENKSVIIKQIKFMADLRYEKFTALVDAGFSKEQSLYLVEKTGLFS